MTTDMHICLPVNWVSILKDALPGAVCTCYLVGAVAILASSECKTTSPMPRGLFGMLSSVCQTALCLVLVAPSWILCGFLTLWACVVLIPLLTVGVVVFVMILFYNRLLELIFGLDNKVPPSSGDAVAKSTTSPSEPVTPLLTPSTPITPPALRQSSRVRSRSTSGRKPKAARALFSNH